MDATEILRPGGTLTAARPEGRTRSDRFERGRTCAFEGCPTVLSLYNPADHCWTHTEPRPKIALGRRPREQEGPRVLSGPEELGMIRSLLGTKARPGRHPEPQPEPMPGPPSPSPQPMPQPTPPA
jgi:hypothetical protein